MHGVLARFMNQGWWYPPEILVLERWRQEGQVFRIILDYRVGGSLDI